MSLNKRLWPKKYNPLFTKEEFFISIYDFFSYINIITWMISQWSNHKSIEIIKHFFCYKSLLYYLILYFICLYWIKAAYCKREKIELGHEMRTLQSKIKQQHDIMINFYYCYFLNYSITNENLFNWMYQHHNR